MLFQQGILGLIDPGSKPAGTTGVRMDALHQGPMGLADRLRPRPG